MVSKREGITMGRGERIRIILVATLVAGITFSHYFTEWKVHYYHIFYQGLYFLPVMLAGFWFGVRGALCVSLKYYDPLSSFRHHPLEWFLSR